MQNKYLGIDAGATKTHAVLYGEDGNVLYETTQGHGNMIVNENEAIQNVTTAIAQCLKQVRDTDVVKLLLGTRQTHEINNSLVSLFMLK
ncbi:hypothetical protein RyT2_29730 [Pseudolactococcus yaeyamensis]